MIFFTSDEHYNHVNVLSFTARPFSSMEDMIEGLIARNNEVVTPEDTVIHLGDFLMGYEKHIHLPKILPRLTGKHYLVTGNHDPIFTAKDGSERYDRITKMYLDSGFINIYVGHKSIPLQGISGVNSDFSLSHFPYDILPDRPDRDPHMLKLIEKYVPVFNPDRILLHGHTHSTEKIQGRNMIHVGVDAWNYYPVSMDQILQLLASDPYGLDKSCCLD